MEKNKTITNKKEKSLEKRIKSASNKLKHYGRLLIQQLYFSSEERLLSNVKYNKKENNNLTRKELEIKKKRKNRIKKITKKVNKWSKEIEKLTKKES